MNRKLLPTLAISISFFFVAVTLLAIMTLAANFNASVSPSTTHAGTNDIMVNFSIQNTDGVQNITQVNITLPPGFVYSGNLRQGIGTFSILNNGEVLSWSNGSGVVYATSTNYIWFEVDTPKKTGNFDFNVSSSDSVGALTTSNVTVNLMDIKSPTWSSNTTSPAAVSYYTPGCNYTFNITWTDNVAVDSVTFEWNGATNYTNTTTPAVISHGSGKYGIELHDLPVTNYTYRWYANDTNTSGNSTASLPYKVLPYDNVIRIYLNSHRDQSIVVNQGTQVNITATGHGTLYIYENNNLLTTGIGPLTTMRSLSVGNYSYKVNSSSTANYTRNSTGATYVVRAIYPPPKYSIAVEIPSTWYRNAYANWTVTWSDDNDPNAFDTAFIQLNHTGTVTNYTMNRTAGYNVSYYSLNLSRPMNLTWRIYANNSYGSWNSTNLTFVEIAKITPTVLLNITPALNVQNGTETRAHCTSPHVTVNLYRDGASVSNPDIYKLSTGPHIYTCNTTETTNYSAYSVAKIVNVVRDLIDVRFTKAEDIVPVEQGLINSTIISVKNIGNATHYIAFSILGISSDYYTMNSTNVSTRVGQNASFLVTFSVPESLQAKDYNGTFRAVTRDKTIIHDFVMRVMPNEDMKKSIDNTLVFQQVNMTRVWTEINESKSLGYNVTAAESKIIEAKAMIDLAKEYANAGNYFEANSLLDDIRTLIAGAETELSAVLEEEAAGRRIPLSWIIIIVVVVSVVGFLAYLLWPQPGYDTRAKKYRYKAPKQAGMEKIKGAKDKISEKFSKKQYRPYRYRGYSGTKSPSEQIYIKPAQEMKMPTGMEATDAISKKPGEVPKKPAESDGASEALKRLLKKMKIRKTVTGKKNESGDKISG